MPTPSDIVKCIEKSVLQKVDECLTQKVDALVDAKFQEFLKQMMTPASTESVPHQEVEEETSDGESTRRTWTEEDKIQTAICYVEGITPKVAHRLFPHLKEGSIKCKYREYQYILTNGREGFHGSESSRIVATETLRKIGAL